MPAVDLVAYVRGIDTGWGMHEENTARLLDIRDYQLALAWIDRTVDPQDPEVARDRAQARRAGITPPPRPLVPPVALRPPELAEQHWQRHLDAVAAYQARPQGSGKPVTSAEFDEALGL